MPVLDQVRRLLQKKRPKTDDEALTARNQVLHAYKSTFDNPLGEIVLDDLSTDCFINEVTLVQGDPYQTAFREGRRSVVLKIMDALERAYEDKKESSYGR